MSRVKGFFKNFLSFLLLVLIFILISSALIKYSNEKELCLNKNYNILHDIVMATKYYLQCNKDLPPVLKLLKTKPYWSIDNKINDWRDPSRTFASRFFINKKTNLENNCSFIYNPNINIKKSIPYDFIIAAEPFPTDGYRYVAFLNPKKDNENFPDSVQRISEKEFQEIAKKYKWNLPYTTRDDELEKINAKSK
ncbi:MAG: hypothetical protein A2017_18760 [Lentisphaerae bacterium GWF2_44_16]|nr:MAG: hypothetical protein A2017_18760 [Lentisphaerae bacterium GWF2_44_16]